MDSVEVNSEAIYIGCQSINYAKKNMSDLLSLLSAKKINYSLIKNLGFEYQPILNDLGNQFGELEDYNTKLLKIKNVLLKADPNNEYLFQQIDLQFKGMDLGEEPSQADYASYIEMMGKVYHVAKNKDVNELTDYEKAVIQTYEGYGFAEFDSYQEMLKEIEEAQNEYNILSEKYKTGNGIGGYSVNTDYYEEAADKKRMAELKEKMDTLEDKVKVLEKDLKEKGLVELSAGDELKIAGKQFLNTLGSFKDNLLDGNFDDAFDDAKTMAATGVMVVNKFESGVLKIGEYVNDGLTMLKATGASIYTLGIDAIFGTNYTDELWDATMDYVAIDQVGEMEKFYYEDTKIGQFINNNSLLKYDSKGAEAIKEFGTRAGEKAIAITLGSLTGGLAVPFVVGFLEGTGKAGEERFSQKDEDGNYINRDFDDITYSYLKGFQKGAEWLSTASTGTSFVTNVKSLLSLKPDELIKALTAENLKQALKDGVVKTVKSPSLYISLASTGAGGGAEYIAEGEIDLNEYFGKITKTIGVAYLGNVFGALKENMSAQHQAIATKIQLADKTRGQITGAIDDANTILNNDTLIPSSNYNDASIGVDKAIGNTSDGLLGTNFGANVSVDPNTSTII